jgi:hypothetical protein
MARMMGKTIRLGACTCWDCGGPNSEDRGRAWEKQKWMREVNDETRIRYGDSLDPRDWAEEDA